MLHNTKSILYVDDDEDDRLLLQEAISMIGEPVEVHTAENGLEALKLLSTWKENKGQPPCLIILDLNMPFLDGRQTFQRLKRDEQLCDVPVMIYSSSKKPLDSQHFESLGVTYITKPSDLKHLVVVAQMMVAECCRRA